MKLQRGSISYLLLNALEKSVKVGLQLEDLIYNPQSYIYSGYPRDVTKSAFYQAVKRLKENGLVTEEVLEDELILKLTDQGRELVFLNQPENEWDGKWRIVIFDIPEKQRVVRNLFRRNLKKWGFKYVQNSAWVSKKNITEKLFAYIKELKIEKWVLVIESDKVGPNNAMLYDRTP